MLEGTRDMLNNISGEYELITLNRDNQELVEDIAILNINRD